MYALTYTSHQILFDNRGTYITTPIIFCQLLQRILVDTMALFPFSLRKITDSGQELINYEKTEWKSFVGRNNLFVDCDTHFIFMQEMYCAATHELCIHVPACYCKNETFLSIL